MLDINDYLANLTMGELPLAIGTSFAIESACGILKDRDAEGNALPTPSKRPPLNDVNELWINVRTLFRNLFNALDNDVKEKLLPIFVEQLILREMQMIPNTVKQIMGDHIKIRYYVCSLQSLPKTFPNAILKTMNTDKQKFYWDLEQHIAFYFLKNEKFPVERFDVKINGQFPKAFIITHQIVDLLWRYRFDQLFLLESHTGKVKPPNEWNTKLTNGKDYPQIPFNRFTMQVFGDNGNLFSPVAIGLKRMIIELSKEKRWTSITTKEKISQDLDTLHDHAARHYFKSLLLGS